MSHDEIEYKDSGIPQPYHLVEPSIWPILGAFAAGLMMGGMILFMHKVKIGSLDLGWGWPIIGLVGVLAIMAVWWRDIISEATFQKLHSPLVKLGLRYGMALFIASEVMFFSAFFWAYYSAALYPPAIFGGTWPPNNIAETVAPFDMPFMMTLILLLSGTTVTWAHHAIVHGDKRGLINGLACTVALGVSFSLCQAYEYTHAEFGLTAGIYGSTFYMATGFHGLHVIIGTIFLAVCLWRAKQGHFTKDSHFGLEAAAWYWHFVDVVWLFLFVSVYWYGSR